jgi:hypothetical protein
MHSQTFRALASGFMKTRLAAPCCGYISRMLLVGIAINADMFQGDPNHFFPLEHLAGYLRIGNLKVAL